MWAAKLVNLQGYTFHSAAVDIGTLTQVVDVDAKPVAYNSWFGVVFRGSGSSNYWVFRARVVTTTTSTTSTSTSTTTLPPGLLTGAHDTGKFTRHSGTTSTILDSFSNTAWTINKDITWGGNDLYHTKIPNRVFRHYGFTPTILSSLTWVGVSGLAYCYGNFWITDWDPDRFYKLLGFSTTVTNSFVAPFAVADHDGLDFDGQDLYYATASQNRVYHFSGQTNVVKATFSLSGVRGIVQDRQTGNILTAAAGKLRVHSGFSSVVIDSFSLPPGTVLGIGYIPQHAILPDIQPDLGNWQILEVQNGQIILHQYGDDTFGVINRTHRLRVSVSGSALLCRWNENQVFSGTITALALNSGPYIGIHATSGNPEIEQIKLWSGTDVIWRDTFDSNQANKDLRGHPPTNGSGLWHSWIHNAKVSDTWRVVSTDGRTNVEPISFFHKGVRVNDIAINASGVLFAVCNTQRFDRGPGVVAWTEYPQVVANASFGFCEFWNGAFYASGSRNDGLPVPTGVLYEHNGTAWTLIDSQSWRNGAAWGEYINTPRAMDGVLYYIKSNQSFIGMLYQGRPDELWRYNGITTSFIKALRGWKGAGADSYSFWYTQDLEPDGGGGFYVSGTIRHFDYDEHVSHWAMIDYWNGLPESGFQMEWDFLGVQGVSQKGVLSPFPAFGGASVIVYKPAGWGQQDIGSTVMLVETVVFDGGFTTTSTSTTTSTTSTSTSTTSSTSSSTSTTTITSTSTTTTTIIGHLVVGDYYGRKIKHYAGFTSVVAHSFSHTGRPWGVTHDNASNIIATDYTNDWIVVYSGNSNTILDSFATPDYSTHALDFDGTNLLSSNWSAKVYKHGGIGPLILDSFSFPNLNGSAIAWWDGNLYQRAWSDERIIYVYSGFSTTLTTSFLTQSDWGWNISFLPPDGDLIADDNTPDKKIHRYYGRSGILWDLIVIGFTAGGMTWSNLPIAVTSSTSTSSSTTTTSTSTTSTSTSTTTGDWVFIRNNSLFSNNWGPGNPWTYRANTLDTVPRIRTFDWLGIGAPSLVMSAEEVYRYQRWYATTWFTPPTTSTSTTTTLLPWVDFGAEYMG